MAKPIRRSTRVWMAGVMLLLAADGAVAQKVGPGPCAARALAVTGDEAALLPLAGFVEVCRQDTALCRRLSAGYPPSTTTLGFFVPDEEWVAYRRGALQGFTQYLIAQKAGSMSPSAFPGFKQHLHAQQGGIPDHTRLPAQLEPGSRVPLGIFDESDNSISFGVVMSARPAGTGQAAPIALVATNSALALRSRVLYLYVYRRYGTAADIDRAKEQTRAWLGCLRTVN